MTFVRGVVIIGISMAYSGVRCMFANFWGQDQENVLKPYLETVVSPTEMKTWKAGAMAGLEGLRALCLGDALRMKYWEMTTEIAKRSDEEPFTGTWCYILWNFKQYLLTGHLPHSVEGYKQPLRLVDDASACRVRSDNRSQRSGLLASCHAL